MGVKARRPVFDRLGRVQLEVVAEAGVDAWGSLSPTTEPPQTEETREWDGAALRSMGGGQPIGAPGVAGLASR
jgi:hypothetical protein